MNEKELEELTKTEFAFAKCSTMSGAISFDEFLEWVDFIVAQYDNLPTFIFDLMDVKSIGEASALVNKNYTKSRPRSGLDEKEIEVLWGIALKRFPDMDFDEIPISPKTALKRLEQYPHVVERFKKTFPFIKLDF